jgi:plasmid maintenance system antidote protein VapI
VNRVTGIINGQRAITADTALRLGHWFSSICRNFMSCAWRAKKLATV